VSNSYLGNEEVLLIPTCSLVCQVHEKNSISSNSDAISGIKKCLRYGGHWWLSQRAELFCDFYYACPSWQNCLC